MQCLSKLLLVTVAATLLAACDDTPSWLGGGEKHSDILPGKRVAVLIDRENELKPDSSLSGTPIILPSAGPSEQWTQHGGNAASAIEHPAFSGDLRSRAQTDIGKAYAPENGEIPSPVVAEGAVFAMDARGNISAHETTDIAKIRWVSEAIADRREAMLGGGLAYANGALYAVSGRGVAAAFDARTGKRLWQQNLAIPVRAAPKADDKMAYIVTADSQLFALDAKSGTIVWNHSGIHEGASFLSHASPSLSGGIVVAPYSSGEIFALNASTGAEGWTDTLSMARRTNATGLFSDISSDPVIVGNALYVAGNAGIIGAYRLDNGQRVWEKAIATTNPLRVVGNAMFVLTTTNTLAALNRMDGRVYWTTSLPLYKDQEEKKGRYHWAGPTLAGGKIYVAGSHGEMQIFSPADGKQLGSVSIPQGIETAPVIANNTLYLAGQDATLHALR